MFLSFCPSCVLVFLLIERHELSGESLAHNAANQLLDFISRRPFSSSGQLYRPVSAHIDRERLIVCEI